jgi:branched-chain amino acid transport system substrate-binding protein
VLAGCASKEERAAQAASAAGASWSAGVPTLRVGLAAPVTGPFAVLGISQQNSLQVVADQINAAGGIGGAKVELVVRDTGLDPAKAVQAANEFAGDQTVGLVVGPSITAFYNAAKGAYESGKKVNCQPAVAAGTFSDLEYGFRSQEAWSLSIQRLLDYTKAQGVTSLGLVYEADDTGKYVDSLLKELAPAAGLQYVGYETTRPDDQSHRAQVEKLRDAGALFISSNASGAKTMAAAGEIGYQGKIISGSGMQNIAFIEAAGDAAKGAAFAAPNYQWPIRDRATWQPGYRAHVEAVEKAYGVNTGPKTGATSPKGTAIAADCLYAYAKAAEQAKSIEPDAVVGALTSIDLPAAETPSGNAVKPTAEHEFYDLADVHVYQWDKDAQGWFTTEVTVP